MKMNYFVKVRLILGMSMGPVLDSPRGVHLLRDGDGIDFTPQGIKRSKSCPRRGSRVAPVPALRGDPTLKAHILTRSNNCDI